MPAYTSRLNLYKPGNGVSISPDEAADVSKINDNMDLVDDAVGAKVVTSGTRPASPYTGQVIYETDTQRSVVWNGSSWVGASGALEVDVETLQDRVTARPADLTALAALATGELLAGDLARVTAGGAYFGWSGSAWVQLTRATFADAATRDTEYAKASAAYLVQGVEAMTSDTGAVWRYYGVYNVTTNKGGALAAGWYPHAGTPYAARCSIAKSSVTAQVNFDLTVIKDVFGLVDTGTDRITVQVAGLYSVSAHRGHSGTIANSLNIFVNGVSVSADGRTGAAGASSSGGIETLLVLAVGDYVEVKISAASSLTFDSSGRCELRFVEVRTA